MNACLNSRTCRLSQYVVFCVAVLLSNISYAMNVTETEVWLVRFQDQHGHVTHEFYSDIWGTIDMFNPRHPREMFLYGCFSLGELKKNPPKPSSLMGACSLFNLAACSIA